jgi:hypothetical protein
MTIAVELMTVETVELPMPRAVELIEAFPEVKLPWEWTENTVELPTMTAVVLTVTDPRATIDEFIDTFDVVFPTESDVKEPLFGSVRPAGGAQLVLPG